MPDDVKLLADAMSDFNARFTSIVENDRLDTEGKNLAIGLLVATRAPMLRKVAAALRARGQSQGD